MGRKDQEKKHPRRGLWGAREERTPINFSCPISVVLSQWEPHFYQIHIHHFEHSEGKVLYLPLFFHFSSGYFKLILVLTAPSLGNKHIIQEFLRKMIMEFSNLCHNQSLNYYIYQLVKSLTLYPITI